MTPGAAHKNQQEESPRDTGRREQANNQEESPRDTGRREQANKKEGSPRDTGRREQERAPRTRTNRKNRPVTPGAANKKKWRDRPVTPGAANKQASVALRPVTPGAADKQRAVTVWFYVTPDSTNKSKTRRLMTMGLLTS